MKVLLVNPPWPGKGYGTRSQNRIIKHRADKFIQFPIMMAYAVSQLKKRGHEVFWLDSVMDEIDLNETLSKVKEINPDVVMMETTTPSIEYDFSFLEKVKEATNAFIIAVGQHVTALAKESLKECGAIDVVIKGEFDPWIGEVLANKKDLSKVKSIAYRKDNKIYDNGPAVFVDNLDSLPFPDREVIPFNKYGESWYNLKPFTNMLTSRGCPYACSFCLSAHVMEGKRWRARSVRNIIEEIKELVEKYEVRELNIDDPTFTISKERTIEFCRALRDNHLRILWTINGRADNVDEEMLREMRKSGCKMIRYGMESGDQEVLDKIGKKLTVEKVKKAIELTKKHKILALAGFMFGFPYDTKKSIEKTVQAAKQLKPDLIQTSIVLPYPGTKLYEQAKEWGSLDFKKWSDFDMTHGPVVKMDGVDKKELQGILKRMYNEFYFRPSFVLQTLFSIRRISDVTRIFRTFLTLVRTSLFYARS